MPTQTQRFLSAKQAALALGVTQRTIRRWIVSGRLPAEKLGPGTASYIIAARDVERLSEDVSA